MNSFWSKVVDNAEKRVINTLCRDDIETKTTLIYYQEYLKELRKNKNTKEKKDEKQI